MSASPREGSASPTAHLGHLPRQTIHASPGVRRYAREHGADIARIEGSGPKQRVLQTDVIAHIREHMQTMSREAGEPASAPNEPQPRSSRAGLPSIPTIDFASFGPVESVAFDPRRQRLADHRWRAWLNVPMVTHHDWADIGEVDAYRHRMKNDRKVADHLATLARSDTADPRDSTTVPALAFHLRALATTIRDFPAFNASLSADGQQLILKQYLHVAVSVDTPRGSLAPVIRDVDRKGLVELASEVSKLHTKAREDRLDEHELEGACLTVSNLGNIGGRWFTPLVNAPEVAILGIGRSRQMPVWIGDTVESRHLCPLSLSYDHRVIDGADAARFLAAYIVTLGDTRRLLS